MVPSADAIQNAAEGLAGQIKKNGVEGLSKETFGLLEAQQKLIENLGKMSDFVKVEGMDGTSSSKQEKFTNYSDAYRS